MHQTWLNIESQSWRAAWKVCGCGMRNWLCQCRTDSLQWLMLLVFHCFWCYQPFWLSQPHCKSVFFRLLCCQPW